MATLNPRLRSDAKHPRVAQDLRMQIVGGHYQPGQRLPFREQLQDQLGASQATVQTALNTLLREGYLRTVLGQGTFVTDRPPFLADVALVYPLVQEAFPKHRLFAALGVEATHALAARPGILRTYFGVSEPHGQEYERLLDDARCHRVAGVIWAGLNFPLHQSPLWADPSLPPRIALQRSPNSYFRGSSVYPDMDSFLRLSLQRLARQGRRRPAILTCDPTPETLGNMQRLADDVGLHCLPQNVVPVMAEWSSICRRIVPLLLAQSSSTRPDAIIIADDNLVSDATAAILATGQAVPDDLSVVCLAHLPMPPEIHVPCDVLAFDAAQLVNVCLQAIDLQRRGRKPKPLTLIQPQWVTAGSEVGSRFAAPSHSL